MRFPPPKIHVIRFAPLSRCPTQLKAFLHEVWPSPRHKPPSPTISILGCDLVQNQRQTRGGGKLRVPNPGKQSIWRQCPPSVRKQSTKKNAKSPHCYSCTLEPSREGLATSNFCGGCIEYDTEISPPSILEAVFGR